MQNKGTFVIVENWTRRVRDTLGNYFQCLTNTHTRTVPWDGTTDCPEGFKEKLKPFGDGTGTLSKHHMRTLIHEGTMCFSKDEGIFGVQVNIILIKHN